MQTENSLPTVPEKWSVEEVADYLDSLNIKKDITKLFVKNEVNGLILISLTVDDLKAEPFNLKSFADVRSVQVAINRINKGVAVANKKKTAEYPVFSNSTVLKTFVANCVRRDCDLKKFTHAVSCISSNDIDTVLIELVKGTEPIGSVEVFLQAFKVLAERATQNAKDTALLWMSTRGCHSEMFSTLIQNGANVNIQFQSGATPLFALLLNGEVMLSKMLMENGATITHSFQTPTANNQDAVLFPNDKFKTGDTALVAAVIGGLPQMLFELLTKFSWQPDPVSRAMIVAIQLKDVACLTVLAENNNSNIVPAQCGSWSFPQPQINHQCSSGHLAYTESCGNCTSHLSSCKQCTFAARVKQSGYLSSAERPLTPYSYAVLQALIVINNNQGNYQQELEMVKVLYKNNAVELSPLNLASQDLQAAYPHLVPYLPS